LRGKQYTPFGGWRKNALAKMPSVTNSQTSSKPVKQLNTHFFQILWIFMLSKVSRIKLKIDKIVMENQLKNLA
jgi:hypothetical protein